MSDAKVEDLGVVGNGKCAVVAEEEFDGYAGRIAIPDTARGKACRGTIVRTGRCERNPFHPDDPTLPTFKEGQRVAFGKFAGVEIELAGGKKFLILRQDEILAAII